MSQNIILNVISDHTCYILKSINYNRIYVGYTINFSRRIRQHNGEIVGGAKRTKGYRPWVPLCTIQGFYDASSALRFEYRLQKWRPRRKAKENPINYICKALGGLIEKGDGSIIKDNKTAWPTLLIKWYSPDYKIEHTNVINIYQ